MKIHTRRFRPTVLSALALASIAASAGKLAAQVPATWNGGNGNWSTSSNWTPNAVPNSANADVRIDANQFSASVTVDGAFTVGRLTLDSLDQLKIADGKSLTVAAGGFSGSGTLLNNSAIT